MSRHDTEQVHTPRRWRCVTAGRRSPTLYFDDNTVYAAWLSKTDIYKVRSLPVGGEYTDADGDMWRRQQ